MGISACRVEAFIPILLIRLSQVQRLDFMLGPQGPRFFQQATENVLGVLAMTVHKEQVG